MENKKEFIKSIGKDKLLIMAVAGIVLIISSYLDFSEEKTKSENKTKTIKSVDREVTGDYVTKMETRLQELLQNVQGAGECRVMITVKGTEEKILQSDTNTKMKSETGENQLSESEIIDNTLVLQGEDEDNPYVVKELMPEVEGVVVVAKGAGNTKVNADIVKIVQALFDVETHKISIIEMR